VLQDRSADQEGVATVNTDSLGSSLTVAIRPDHEQLTWFHAARMLATSTNGIAGLGTVASRHSGSFVKELLATGEAVCSQGSITNASANDEIFVIADQILPTPRGITGVARGHKVLRVVVEDVAVNVISDKTSEPLAGPQAPGHFDLAPVAPLWSEPDLAVQDIPVNQDFIMSGRQGVPSLLKAPVSSSHNSSNGFRWVGNTLTRGGQPWLEAL
jgi:hypothetical protein